MKRFDDNHRDGLSLALASGAPFVWRGKLRGEGARTGRVDRRRMLRAVAARHVDAANILAVMASTPNCTSDEVAEALGVVDGAEAVAQQAVLALNRAAEDRHIVYLHNRFAETESAVRDMRSRT